MKKAILFIAIFILSGSTACGQATIGPEVYYTQAAQTIAVEQTLQEGAAAVARLTQLSNQTPTSPPTATRTLARPTITITPSPTILEITSTSSPTPTLIPTVTLTLPPQVCNQAAFILDVNTPPGTILASGASFSKIWRIENVGYCTWTPDYALVFSGGTLMNAPNLVQIGATIPPGATIDLSVQMIAPTNPGVYMSFWMLSDANDNLFGMGPQSDQPLQVDIQVGTIASEPVPTDSLFPFDFVAQLCNATWQTSNEQVVLPCPGVGTIGNSWVAITNSPTFETGKTVSGRTLLVHLALSGGQDLVGVFPAYTVNPGDIFIASLGCPYNPTNETPACQAVISLSYRIRFGPDQLIARWKETYDQKITQANVDLSALAGQSVQFVITITNKDPVSPLEILIFEPGIKP